jgi:hypothetical protein
MSCYNFNVKQMLVLSVKEMQGKCLGHCTKKVLVMMQGEWRRCKGSACDASHE